MCPGRRPLRLERPRPPGRRATARNYRSVRAPNEEGEPSERCSYPCPMGRRGSFPLADPRVYERLPKARLGSSLRRVARFVLAASLTLGLTVHRRCSTLLQTGRQERLLALHLRDLSSPHGRHDLTVRGPTHQPDHCFLVRRQDQRGSSTNPSTRLSNLPYPRSAQVDLASALLLDVRIQQPLHQIQCSGKSIADMLQPVSGAGMRVRWRPPDLCHPNPDDRL